ncbi:MAG TPA: EAL domain-containing protein [Solirubrobacteraceae bacterium]|nr:EAL domain-containing protein [Solirubrobacteraceae bacterium]
MSQLAHASQSGNAGIPPDLQWKIEYSRAIISALPEASVIILDTEERILVAEGKVLTRDSTDSAVLDRRLRDVVPEDRQPMLIARYRSAVAGNVETFDYTTSRGTLTWIQITPIYMGGETPVAVAAVIQDLTERHRISSELHRERELRRSVEEVAGIGHWEADLSDGSAALSDGAQALLGLPRTVSELTISSILEHVNASDRERVSSILGALPDGAESELECDLHGHDGERRAVIIRARREDDQEGHPRIAGTAIDITALRDAQRAQSESEALFGQGFDSSPIGMALVTPGEKRFLRVNDALCEFLARSREDLLTMCCSDVTYDEDLTADEEAREAMLAAARVNFQTEKRYVRPDGSLVWGSMHVTPVYSAKGEIRGFFSQIVDLTAHKERELALVQQAADLARLAEIRAAIADERLVLHAQPIVDLRTGQVVQQELLVRMVRENGELMPPGEFLPLAERHGCITEIDRWVVEQAVGLAADGIPVEVNLSAASVGDSQTLATIREALARTGADPGLLVFEVTETAVMADVDRGRRFAQALRELGCRFALDDFGTGYGTFTYLRHIPIDYLKIDIEFVRELPGNEADLRLVRAIVHMAKELGKKTIAEGVENGEALVMLRGLGVDHAQGYHIGRPAPIEARPEAQAA